MSNGTPNFTESFNSVALEGISTRKPSLNISSVSFCFVPSQNLLNTFSGMSLFARKSTRFNMCAFFSTKTHMLMKMGKISYQSAAFRSCFVEFLSERESMMNHTKFVHSHQNNCA